MAKVLTSISLDAPTGTVSASVDDTFAFSGTPGFTGTGGVQRYDFQWQVDGGAGYVTMGASGTGLITADANPVTNSNGATQKSITVSCESAGSYTIRMAGAPITGGAYTIFSSTQTVEVSEPAGVDDMLAEDVASASSVTTPAIGQAHVLNAADVASASSVGAPVLGQVHMLTADDVASGSSVTTPVIALVVPLLAEDLASASSVGTPALGQVHALLAADIISTPVVGNPAIGQVHALSADDVAATPSLSSPTLVAVAVIVPKAPPLAVEVPVVTPPRHVDRADHRNPGYYSTPPSGKR